ncbi:hypothetical protein ESZ50_05725 [Weissella muntiaci]|uniref:Holin n=1 Tax=Weissella muntiaci TaxID=2508881 RepID=A0A6C2C7K1_9LACO|nr:hypothetical protein [Weissella muntiaci]TYC49642.1 hypothetical protein ESZ50_05725 [Weissella muntiaci]
MLDLAKYFIELVPLVAVATAWYLNAKQKINAQYDADVAKAEQEYKKSVLMAATTSTQGK